MLEIRLLGTFGIHFKKKSISITSRPAQSLFAYLVLNAGIAHRREKLAGMLWPDSLEETARDNLRHALWRIRKALPSKPAIEYLVTDDLTITFNASADHWLDASALKKLNDNASIEELMMNLSDYEGELLPGFFDEWVMLEREHLSSLFEHHMARLLWLLQEENRWLDILEWGERWIKLGQRPEPAFRALMSAHAAKGDMSKVVATYERCVKSLKEFGFEPSEQTQALLGRLKTGKESLGAGTYVAVVEKPRASKRTNLPVPLTSFIGREKEVGEIIRLLSQNRLVTLLGSGGVGKTRLAIRSSQELVDQFKDGVWWVDLVGLNDDSLVPKEVARVLGLSETSNLPALEMVINHLTARQALLVVDNCEHLISACAQLADRLLATCENLKILVTSREALDIFGEIAWHVPSLSLPGKDTSLQELDKFESIRLFAERAGAMQPQFHLDDQSVMSVAQICRRLSGMPLAIELAAARVKMMSVDEIASRLNDRFDLLTSGSRAALPRHQTLRATIDWSYELLTSTEKVLFQRLSVFAGGFTLAAAESILGFNELKRGDIVDLLGRLVDKSLVMVHRSPQAATRYRLLETIREYARQKREESGASIILQDRHLEYFVSLGEEAEQNTVGAESVQYHLRLDQELDNIRAAMEWAIESRQASMAFRLGSALFYFWYNRSPMRGEWQEQLNRALELQEGTARTLERARALNAKGYFYWADAVPQSPRMELEDALSIGRELDDPRIIARSLLNLGLAETVEENYAEARAYFEQSLDLSRQVHPPNVEYIWSLTFLGDIYFSQNDLEAAKVHYAQSVNTLREMRDRNFLAYVVRRLAQLAWHKGEFREASRLCEDSLTLNQELADERGVLASLSGFAGIAVAQGRWDDAACLFGATHALLETSSIRLVYMDRVERERNLALLRTQMSLAELESAMNTASSWTLEQTIEHALGMIP